MNIQKIKAALATQARLLGVVPVANTVSAQAETVTTKSTAHSATVTAPAVVTKKETLKTAPTIVAASANSVSSSLFDTIAVSPTVSPNISKIPSERQATVTITSAAQTPTLPTGVFPASQLTLKTAADSVVSLVHSNQLSLQPETLLVPEEPKPARKRKKEETPIAEPIEIIVAKHLKAGRDYDRLPNTSKPTLFKSGAEILCGVYGYRTTTSVINRVIDFEKSFVMYELQVTVYGADDKVVAEGIGSCNSRERKYLRGDFATQLNTILKMAKKRAYVDAILTACHASKVFTQDVEDIAAGVADDVTKKGA